MYRNRLHPAWVGVIPDGAAVSAGHTQSFPGAKYRRPVKRVPKRKPWSRPATPSRPSATPCCLTPPRPTRTPAPATTSSAPASAARSATTPEAPNASATTYHPGHQPRHRRTADRNRLNPCPSRRGLAAKLPRLRVLGAAAGMQLLLPLADTADDVALAETAAARGSTSPRFRRHTRCQARNGPAGRLRAPPRTQDSRRRGCAIVFAPPLRRHTAGLSTYQPDPHHHWGRCQAQVGRPYRRQCAPPPKSSADYSP